MSTIRQIGIVGRIADHICDGQTIKTRVLMNELRSHYPNSQIIVAQTHDFKKRPFHRLFELLNCLRTSDVVIVLLSNNGRRIIFPIMYWANKLLQKPLFHDCIGGALDKDILNRPIMKKYYSMFVSNWVETESLKKRLTNLGVNNVEVIPNFKSLTLLSDDDLSAKASEPFRFCTFSRVTRDKGIGIAAQAVIDINCQAERQCVQLDVYGPFEDGYENELQAYIRESNGAVQYKGVIDYNGSVHVLKDYYMLLFPTWFAGEGFPGTLIDAFSSGLPVIATDWHCNGEIIKDQVTGFLYPTEEQHQLRQLMEYAMQNPNIVFEMRKNCLREVQKYNADVVMQTICDRIEQELARKK